MTTMKFKLFNSKDSFKNEHQPILFFRDQTTNSLLTKFKQLEKLAPLLQKKLEKPNQLSTTFLGQTPVAFFSLDNQKSRFYKIKRLFKKSLTGLKSSKTKRSLFNWADLMKRLQPSLFIFWYKYWQTLTTN